MFHPNYNERFNLPETGEPIFVTANECLLTNRNINDKLRGIEQDVEKNRITNDKILKLLRGNGEDGLIWKVNMLMMRRHWVDKAFSFGFSIAGTLVTLYLAGVLKL